MILGMNGLPVLAGANAGWLPEFLRPSNQTTAQPAVRYLAPGDRGTQRIASMDYPWGKVQLYLDRTSPQIQVPGSIHTWRTRVDLAIGAAGDITGRQLLVRKNIYAQTANMPQEPITAIVLRDLLMSFDWFLFAMRTRRGSCVAGLICRCASRHVFSWEMGAFS